MLFQRALGNIQPGARDVLGITLPCINPAPPELEAIIESKVDEIYRAATSAAVVAAVGSAGQGTATAKGKKTEATVSFCKERIKRTWYSKSVE